MIQGTIQGFPSFTAKTSVAEGVRLKISTDVTSPATVEIAGASDNTVGFAVYAVSTGELVAVRPVTDTGVQQAIAGGNVTIGASLYAAADGKVATTGTILLNAVALEAGALDDIINIIFTAGISGGT